jgi:hypothetical protein
MRRFSDSTEDRDENGPDADEDGADEGVSGKWLTQN